MANGKKKKSNWKNKRTEIRYSGTRGFNVTLRSHQLAISVTTIPACILIINSVVTQFNINYKVNN